MKFTWAQVVYLMTAAGVAATLIWTVDSLKSNQEKFLTELHEERLNHRMDLIQQKVRFHHPEYYPGPIAIPPENDE